MSRHAALTIERLPCSPEHKVVKQSVTRPGIAGDQDIGSIDIGDVGDAAEIHHGDRSLAIERLRQRAVIDRHERRALPARGDIGRAEIMHHRDMDGLGERGGIADLHGHSLRRPVQHGLAVKADNVHALARDVVLRGKGGDGLGMGDGDGALGIAQDARPFMPLAEVNGFRQRLAQ